MNISIFLRSNVTKCIAGFTFSVVLAGCVGDFKEVKSLPRVDMAAQPGFDGGAVDMAGGDMAGGDMAGGDMAAVGAPTFFPSIEADLDAKSCSGCHPVGGTPPNFVPNPSTQSNKDANYASFKAAAIDAATMADPTASPLLKHLLPGGNHLGGVQLSSTSDPVYQRWLAWIAGGGLK